MSLFLHAVLWLFIGLFIGASLGVVIAGLCAAAGREPEGRWIPLSERLPEDCVDVIVCEIMAGCQCVSVGFYDEAGRQWFSKSETSDCVTHWMPLPPPPEEIK